MSKDYKAKKPDYDTTGVKVFVLHSAASGLIPDTPYGHQVLPGVIFKCRASSKPQALLSLVQKHG